MIANSVEEGSLRQDAVDGDNVEGRAQAKDGVVRRRNADRATGVCTDSNLFGQLSVDKVYDSGGGGLTSSQSYAAMAAPEPADEAPGF